MNSKQFAVLAIIALIVTCMVSPAVCEDRYIVNRDVPENPVFTVVPFNNTQQQITCADYVEEALIYAGVKVLDLPPTRIVETEERADGRQVVEGKEAQSSKVRTERYRRYIEEIKADFIITTSGTWYYWDNLPYYEYIRIRLIKKNTGEIISSFAVKPKGINEAVYYVLKNMGIKVNLTLPKKSKKIESSEGKG